MTFSDEDRAQARQIIADAPDVWDLTIPWVRAYWSVDLLRRYHDAGYSLASLTIQDMPATFAGVIAESEEFRKECAAHTDWLCFVRNSEEIDAARASGKLAISLNVQDTKLVHEDLERLDVLRDLGIRHMLLAYQVRNLAADGCAEPANGGLSLFGRRLVRRMNDAGIIVDGSHVGKRSSLDAIEYSDAPVIFSHSGVRAVHEHIRNIDDEQIRACAGCGGVIGVVGIGAFLGQARASADIVFRHIDHIAQLVGAEHIGIGTDFIDDLGPVWRAIEESGDDAWHPNGPIRYTGDAFAPEELCNLVVLMREAGYPEQSIHGVLGGNFQRIYDGVEQDHSTPRKESRGVKEPG